MSVRCGLIAILLITVSAARAAESGEFFKIRVVDDETGRGVPLVELRTTGDVRYYTDSAGLVAFHEPGLMGQTVFFHVFSHGYEFPKDGFGIRGTRLKAVAGGEATLRIKRQNVAERLYRVTGGGIYRDSVLLGERVPIQQPVLNAQVFGSDSVVNAVFRGNLYWFWGDTNRPSYPLGNFHVPGATSQLPADGGLAPEVGINLNYFTGEDGFARPTCQMPGEGPTWIYGLTVLTDDEGRERMFAGYVKVKPPLEVYERGIVEFDAEQARFAKRLQLDENVPLFPMGHPFLHGDGEQRYVYFASPLPLVRVRATVDDLLNPKTYQTYTYLKRGSRAASVEVDRDPQGRLRVGWKDGTVPLSHEIEGRLLEDHRLKPDEALLRLIDVESRKPVRLHAGSVCWNAYRRRWILIACEVFGTSLLGEVWYAEADRLEGPWTSGRKILTHDKYSFYNPKQHPMFDQKGGRVVYFEGTYVNTFSGNEDRTPRYNYNQVMYRLDLSDARLELPFPEKRGD